MAVANFHQNTNVTADVFIGGRQRFCSVGELLGVSET